MKPILYRTRWIVQDTESVIVIGNGPVSTISGTTPSGRLNTHHYIPVLAPSVRNVPLHLLDVISLTPGAMWKSDSSVWELKKDGDGEHLIKTGTVLGSITTLVFYCVCTQGWH